MLTDRRIARQGHPCARSQCSIQTSIIEHGPTQISGTQADGVTEFDKCPVMVRTMSILLARNVMGLGDEVVDSLGMTDILPSLKACDEMDPGCTDPFSSASVVEAMRCCQNQSEELSARTN